MFGLFLALVEVSCSIDEDEEAACIARAQRDPSEFAALYRQYVDRVFYYVLAKADSLGDAEDITAQVFLDAMEFLPRYRHNGHFAAWLFTIARHRLINFRLRRRPEISLEMAETQAGPREDPILDLIQDEEIRRLFHLIAALRSDEQDLLHLRYVAELSYAEIAVLLGRSEGAVKKQVYRLLARLESQLEAGNE